jgi:phage/plasmid-associated DNA primase
VEHNNTYLHEPVGDLYTSWQSYCKENGDEPGSKKSFSEEMRSHGFTPFKFGHGKVRSFSGIQLKRDTSDNQGSDVDTKF